MKIRQPYPLKPLMVLITIATLCACTFTTNPVPTPDQNSNLSADQTIPASSVFSTLPFHLIGEQVVEDGYAITLSDLAMTPDTLQVSARLVNDSPHALDLGTSLSLYDPRGLRISPQDSAGSLESGSAVTQSFSFPLDGPIPAEERMEYRLLFTPFGWSGPVIAFLLVDTLPAIETPAIPPAGRPTQDEALPSAYNGITGDPWKMLILIYPNIDTDYVEGGVSKHLTASMPAADLNAMRNDFMNNQPHRNHVYDYSGNAGELEAHVVVVDRALTNLEPISNGYWPSPAVTHTELDLYAPDGKYDSVIVFWQASNPDTGQSLPTYGWGLGYWPGSYANGMTYATVFNIGWYWPGDPCHGEVFMHEWLHGVTGFYKDHLGFAFNLYDLHGAEAAGYEWDYLEDGCWDNWLRDYMRGLVYESGTYKALVPAAWQSGSITTHHIDNWRGEYFNNTTLSDIPVVVRNDVSLNFTWQGNPPHPLLNSDGYSVRWSDDITFSADVYQFNLMHDDGARLYVDGVLVFENWCSNCWVTDPVNVTMSAGSHHIVVEMWENQGWSAASLTWQPAVLPPQAFIPLIKK